MEQVVKDLVIVGAGLCGLTIAEQMRAAHISSLIIEKSKGVGGRMASRRFSAIAFDHGAQFYKHTPTSPFHWHERWSEAELNQPWFVENDCVYFRARGAMTNLAKNIAREHSIRFNEKLLSLKNQGKNLELVFESGRNLLASKVVLTSPLPQSLEILRSSGFEYDRSLDSISYAKALVGLYTFSQNRLGHDLASYVKNRGPFASVSVDRQDSTAKTRSLVAIMNPEFSEQHFSLPDAEVLEMIDGKVKSELNASLHFRHGQLKRWRYSHPLTTYKDTFSVLANDDRILLAGDAFGGASLNGAVRSGLATAAYLQTKMSAEEGTELRHSPALKLVRFFARDMSAK